MTEIISNDIKAIKYLSITSWVDCLILSFLVVGMLYSPFLGFLSFCLIGVRVVFLGSLKEKLEKLRNNWLILLVLCSIFLMNIIGLLWTNDISYGMKVLNHKLPFLIIPIYMCIISPIKKPLTLITFIIYILSLLFGTIYGTINYLFTNYTDPRYLIPFTYHILYGINLCFAIAVLCILYYKNKKEKKACGLLVISLWFLAYIVTTQMFTSIILCCILAIFGIFKLLKKKNSKYSILFACILIISLCGLGIWLTEQYKDYFVPKEKYNVNLNLTTTRGNKYVNKQTNFIENGYYVDKYVCSKEVDLAWKERTGLSINDSSENNDGTYPYYFIIYRYLNSKGLRKDYDGVMKLSNKDIDNIRHGFANVVYTERFSLRPRLYRTFFEFERYNSTHHVNNMSVIQRYIWDKNALHVIKKNIVFGVGTGDIKSNLKKELHITCASLCDINQDPHNNFLYTFTGFGVFGILILCLFLLYLPCKSSLWKNSFFVVFFICGICMMMSESSFELMSGIMFYSLFFTFFVFNKKHITTL